MKIDIQIKLEADPEDLKNIVMSVAEKGGSVIPIVLDLLKKAGL